MMIFASIGILLSSLLMPVDLVAPLVTSVDQLADEPAVVVENNTDDTQVPADQPADEEPEDGSEAKKPVKKLGAKSLSTGGWILMLMSVSIVTGMLIWCVYKVLTTPESTKHLHTQADIEPPDIHDEDED